MKTIEQNALRIAELMRRKTRIPIVGAFGDVIFEMPNTEAVNPFMEYNGLMPLVFECNNNNDYYYTRISIDSLDENIVSIWSYCDSQEVADLVAKYGYIGESEKSFIHAIQLAVIKYLELKNADKGIPETI